MKKVLTIGSATQDIFIVYDNPESLHLHTQKGTRSFMLLKQGVKLDVKELHYSSGGGATNTAASFKKLGLDVKSCFRIGNDKAGRYIKEQLESNDIKLIITVDDNFETATSFIIPSINKDCTALVYRGANSQLKFSDIPIDILKSSDVIYITSLAEKIAEILPKIVTTAKENRSCLIALNPGLHQVTKQFNFLYEALKHTDILILNRYEAQKLFENLIKIHNLQKIYSNRSNAEFLPRLLNKFYTINNINYTFEDYALSLISLGIKKVIVTNGSEGIYLATHDSIYFHEGIATETLSTIGAGDACGSTIVGALEIGKTIEDALKFGAINSSSVLKFMDAKQGLLDFNELEQKIKILPADLLHVFPFN